jgi:hypothetical protein
MFLRFFLKEHRMKTLYADRLIERALKCLEKRLCYGSVLLDGAVNVPASA